MDNLARLEPGAAGQARRALDANELLDALTSPVVVIDRNWDVTYANAAAELALGGPIDSLNLSNLFPGFEMAAISGGGSVARTLEHANGTTFHALINPLASGQYAIELRSNSSGSDITPSADLDELTGLQKRNALMAQLDAALRSQEDAGTTAIHCLDLDRFKLVNDTLGHAVGDLLLQKVADRIAGVCRKGDIVARLGGDEFVVLQRDVQAPRDAEKLAERIVDLVGRTYVINGHTININASVGVALAGQISQGRDLLRNGDLALYEAKRAGRGRYKMFKPEMDQMLQERRSMEIDLRRALGLKQFELNYQPFVDLANDAVIGFEALLRWKHPIRGNVPPLDFIALAEENGLIVKIGEWVIRTACLEAASWPGEMIVAVNVSPLQFKADTLLQTITSALEQSGLPAARLEIEITEGALLDDTGTVLATLNALRTLGVKISMDDFGTGYSSLSYLQKFPFNKIKIDRSFVAGTGDDNEAILRAVAALGNSLGMDITAEGVETAEQLTRIRGQRCTHVQGYLTGRPMDRTLIGDFLAQRTSIPGELT